MTQERTGGMTAIGIVNIVLGSIFALLSLFVIIGGGLFAAVAAGAESELAGSDAEGAGTFFAAAGGIMMLIGFVSFLAWSTLGVSGIGILRLKPWGRTLTLVCGGTLAVLNLLALLGGFNLINVFVMGYGGYLVYLCTTEEWKTAFSGQIGAYISSVNTSDPIPTSSSSPIPNLPPINNQNDQSNNENDQFNQAA